MGKKFLQTVAIALILTCGLACEAADKARTAECKKKCDACLHMMKTRTYPLNTDACQQVVKLTKVYNPFPFKFSCWESKDSKTCNLPRDCSELTVAINKNGYSPPYCGS